MPVRVVPSTPTRLSAETFVAPSLPLRRAWLLIDDGAMVAAPPPTEATTRRDGPRSAPVPAFTALARLAQNAALPAVASMLSNTSGTVFGRLRISRHVP